MTSDEQIRAAIAERASEWFVASEETTPDAEESEALVVWLKSSPLHVAEFLRVAAIARDLRAAPADSHSVETLLARARAEDDSTVRPFWSRVLAEVRDARERRWQPLTVAVAVAALAVATLGFLLWWNLRPVEPVSMPAGLTTLHFETRHGEQQTHRLADNSVLHLNTDTAVTIRYSKRERLITLASGQAGFEVAHEAERPFRVLAGPAEVIARGTRFDVRLRNDATVVTVTEGRVAVEPSMLEGRSTDSNRDNRPGFIEVAADQQITVSKGQWPATPVAVDAQHTTAWLHRQIAFDHEPLEAVAAEFNRYAAKPVEITAPELRNLQVTGVFSTDDPAAFIAFLRSLEGVRVDETATRILVSKK
jgi:transmembrane sensor